MSAVDGVNRAKYVAGTVAQKGTLNAQVLSITESYTCSSLADASTIEIGGKIPAGAKMLAVMIKHPAFATGRTVKIGDNHDDDRYAGATSVAAAGTITVPCGNYVVGTNPGDNQLLLTTAGIFDSATAIQVSALYVL